MIQVFNYVEPFQEIGGKRRKRTLAQYTKKAGVYFIWEVHSNALVYVGMSRSCVVEALYRHFYPWNDSRGNHYRTVYEKLSDNQEWRVAIFPTEPEIAHEVEKAFIVSLKPRDNRDRYDALMGNVQAPAAEEEPPPYISDEDLPF